MFQENSMRIWGYVLLILGILFLIVFGLADLGGAHVGYLPFIISFMLVVTGSGLRSSGKGILQAKPAAMPEHSSAAPATAQVHHAAPDAKFSTIEMPLTPDVAAVIARQGARARRNLLYVVGGCVVLFGGAGVLIAATDKTPGEGRMFLLIFGGIGFASAFLIYGISWLTVQKPMRLDLRGATYLRTTGPLQVVPISAGAMLRLADRAFMMNGRDGMAQLSKISFGKVDYTPHGHVILGAWDSEGRGVYCLPDYTVRS
jgi:hypothetical protein